jgi:hypothetical protein
MIELTSITDGNPSLFVSAAHGRPAVDYSAYLPVLKLSWHNRGEDGKGAVKAFASTYGEWAATGTAETHKKGLAWAGRELGCSVVTRWEPTDAKRHAAILKTIADYKSNHPDTWENEPQYAKLVERLNESAGMLNFRAVPLITRPRNGNASPAVAA